MFLGVFRIGALWEGWFSALSCIRASEKAVVHMAVGRFCAKNYSVPL